MNFAAAILKESNSCFGVSIPDLPGCFSAGVTLDEAMGNAQQAIYSRLELLAEKGKYAPIAKTVDEHINNPDFVGATWALIQVDTSAFLGKTEKTTVTLPKLLIRQIDELIINGKIKTRSAFLADSAIIALGKNY